MKSFVKHVRSIFRIRAFNE